MGASDGCYMIQLEGDAAYYYAERENGVWYWADGTGWRCRIHDVTKLVRASFVSELTPPG